MTSASEKKKEDWMNSKWRPMMGWTYMGTCIFDFVIAPVLWSLIQAMHGGQVTSQWMPLTLQGAGLYHVAMGAVLGLTAFGEPLLPLPDGVYKLRYTVAPAYENFVEKTIIRVEVLQEKFDEAFMKLDMMECDRAIKTQQKVDLNTIYFFIQGAIAAANNCAVAEANKLYNQANMMLNNFIKNNCGCSGTNYVLNFQ